MSRLLSGQCQSWLPRSVRAGVRAGCIGRAAGKHDEFHAWARHSAVTRSAVVGARARKLVGPARGRRGQGAGSGAHLELACVVPAVTRQGLPGVAPALREAAAHLAAVLGRGDVDVGRLGAVLEKQGPALVAHAAGRGKGVGGRGGQRAGGHAGGAAWWRGLGHCWLQTAREAGLHATWPLALAPC